MSSEQTQNHASGAAHKKQDRARDGQERFHRRRDRQGNLLGALQGQRLGNEFAEQHVHVSDQAECDRNGDGVGVDRHVGHAMHELQPSTRRATMGSPIQPRVRLAMVMPSCTPFTTSSRFLVEALDNAGADASGFDQLLDARVANADQGKLGRREKCVPCHE